MEKRLEVPGQFHHFWMTETCSAIFSDNRTIRTAKPVVREDNNLEFITNNSELINGGGWIRTNVD